MSLEQKSTNNKNNNLTDSKKIYNGNINEVSNYMNSVRKLNLSYTHIGRIYNTCINQRIDSKWT